MVTPYPGRKNKRAPMLCGLPVFLASLASSAYSFALAISALNSSQLSLLSFGPITLTTVGFAQDMIKNM